MLAELETQVGMWMWEVVRHYIRAKSKARAEGSMLTKFKEGRFPKKKPEKRKMNKATKHVRSRPPFYNVTWQFDWHSTLLIEIVEKVKLLNIESCVLKAYMPCYPIISYTLIFITSSNLLYVHQQFRYLNWCGKWAFYFDYAHVVCAFVVNQIILQTTHTYTNDHEPKKGGRCWALMVCEEDDSHVCITLWGSNTCYILGW